MTQIPLIEVEATPIPCKHVPLPGFDAYVLVGCWRGGHWRVKPPRTWEFTTREAAEEKAKELDEGWRFYIAHIHIPEVP